MSNFVGIVTQQDMQTGVTLRARVTSPKGKYTAYQYFKCMVKKSGLTDEQAVTTDLNIIATKLLSNGVTGITSNLTGYMPTVGENETNVAYNVTGDNISEYFNNDGIVIKRPPYGSNAVIGTLNIVVTKNAALAQRDITISIEPYTSEELVDSVLEAITWNEIRGNNGVETSDPSTNGKFNVIHPLKLIKTITSDLVSTPVSITWEVVEDAMTPLTTQSRIDLETGIITRPKYTDIYEAKNIEILGSLIDITTSKIENAYGRSYLRVGGFILKASISIEDIVGGGQIMDSVIFNLKTLSKPLANSEVTEFLTDNISLFSVKDTKYNSVFTLSTIDDASERTLFIDTATDSASVLEMFNTPGVFTSTINNELTKAGINVINVSWSAIDPATVGTTPVAIPLTNYSTAGLQKIGDNFVLVLNPNTVPTETKLVMRCVISVNSYDGAISYITAFYRFTLDDITPSI